MVLRGPIQQGRSLYRRNGAAPCDRLAIWLVVESCVGAPSTRDSRSCVPSPPCQSQGLAQHPLRPRAPCDPSWIQSHVGDHIGSPVDPEGTCTGVHNGTFRFLLVT